MLRPISLELLACVLLSTVVGSALYGEEPTQCLGNPLSLSGGLGGFGGVLPVGPQEPVRSQSVKLPRANLDAVPGDLTLPIGMAGQDRPIVERLESRRLSLDVREVPLSDVLATVRDQAGCNVLMNGPALEEVGVTSDTPITARLTDTALGQGLKRLLQPYNLTYVVKHGVLMITSQLEADNDLVFRVYPVADLVWTGEVAGDNAVSFDPLIQLLEVTVSPNSWSNAGGAGSVRPFSANLSLAVNQTQAVHEEVVHVLTELRQARGTANAAEIPRNTQELLQSSDRPAVAGINRRESELLRTAHELVVSLSFDEVALSDVVHFVSDFSRLPIDVNRAALEEEGVNEDTPVSIHVSNVRLDDALHLLLGQYNLTWIVKNDVIQITSKIEAGNELRALSYPVGDLVVLTSGDERWSVFQGELEQLIQDIISPNSWSAVGGAGTTYYFAASQCLTVLQIQEVHDQIAALLATLRESSARLEAITRAAGMPTPQELADVQLRALTAATDRARKTSINDEQQRAESGARDESTAKRPKGARRRHESKTPIPERSKRRDE